MARAPLIHIGYHKTGTTLLQRKVFQEVGTGFDLVGSAGDLHQAFVSVNAFAYDPDETRRSFAAKLEASEKRNLVPVLSYERLSGAPHHGSTDSRQIADRLAEAFPEARVLIVIREQLDMILSLYKTYVRMGGPASLEEYVKPGDSRSMLLRLDYLEYHWLISYYQSLFGEKNVLVLPYEMLCTSPSVFLEQIRSFSEAQAEHEVRVSRVNVSPSPLSLMAKRYVNKLFVRNTFNPSPLLPFRLDNRRARSLTSQLSRSLPRKLKLVGRDRWQEFVAEFVGRKRYEESNAITEKITGLSLKDFGYSLPVAPAPLSNA